MAIVDAAFVHRYMEGRSPVGARIRRLVANPDSVGPWIEVVGLVGGIGNSGTEVRPTPRVYLPAPPDALRPAMLAVHAASDPGALASIRAAMGASAFALVHTIGRRAATQLLGGAWLCVAGLALVYTQFVSDGWTPPGSPVGIALAIGVGVTAVIGVLVGVGPARRSLAIEPDRALRG